MQEGAGKEGIKRGNLIISCEAPINQWQFYHQILVDLDDIEWDKPTHTYRSMKSKVSKNLKTKTYPFVLFLF